MTQEQRQQWLEGRRRGIGGSDVAAILWLSPWRTPLDVYSDKLGITSEDSVSQAAYWGTVLEDVVAREFTERTGITLQKVNHQFAMPGNEWAIANIDRAVVVPEIAKRVRVLTKTEDIEKFGRVITTDVAFEAKTANAFSASEWGPSQEEEIRAGKIESEHSIPLFYETQVQWYCGVLNLRGIYLAVLIGGQDYRMYWIESRPDLFAVIKDKCSDFWHKNVLTKVPPEPINLSDVLKYYRSQEKTIEADSDLCLQYGEYSRLSGEIKNLEAERAEYKNKLALALKDYEALTIEGRKVLTFKTTKNGARPMRLCA